MVSIFTGFVSLKTYTFVWECLTRTYSGTEEAELHLFGSQGKAEVWRWNFRSLEVLAKMKCGSGLIHIWKSWQTSVEDEGYLSSPGRAEVRKAELQFFGSQGSAEVRKRNFTSLKVPAEMKCGSELTHTWKSWQNKCGRRTRSFEVLTERSTESGTSDLWQSRQSRSAEAELHIFGSSGRDEIRNWTYPYFEVLVEQVRKKNEIFRSPGRAEVRKTEPLIFGSKDRAELRKQSFRPLKVLAEQS